MQLSVMHLQLQLENPCQHCVGSFNDTCSQGQFMQSQDQLEINRPLTSLLTEANSLGGLGYETQWPGALAWKGVRAQ